MLIIGIMTGNSMDAIDVVLTDFKNNSMKDIAFHTKEFTDDMRQKMQYLRDIVIEDNISMVDLENMPIFNQIHDEYIEQVAKAVNDMIDDYNIDKKDITAIGFHGKTLDHFPPSNAKDKPAYTLQIGSGKMLSELTEIRVISDFRSDDIINGGEGAPLAPMHNIHQAKAMGLNKAIFFNAGNTSNITVINEDKVIGWDAGPFNDFTDKLVQMHTNDFADIDGKYGKNGVIDFNLLKKLFDKSVLAGDGSNYLELNYPKSADPRFYKFNDIEEFKNPNNFENNLRTVEYFSAYVAAHTLKLIPKKMICPNNFVFFGGGWNNPLSYNDFKNILTGKRVFLKEHEELFKEIINRFKNKVITFNKAPKDKYTEARIFADAAYCYLTKTPFTTPQTSGCKTPTILGIDSNNITFSDKICRAAKGWQNKH